MAQDSLDNLNESTGVSNAPGTQGGGGRAATLLGALPKDAVDHFKLKIEPRLTAAKDGDPTGEVWLVRIIEAGRSLNGPVYDPDGLKASVAMFEGAPVYSYAHGRKIGNADQAKQGHLSDEDREAAPRGHVGNLVGRLEGVHWAEEAKALDAFFKVYDQGLREIALNAYNLGDLGDQSERDAFGLSIDARGQIGEDQTTVMRITAVNSVDVVTKPAAGGRIRRLVAAQGEPVEITEAMQAAIDQGVARAMTAITEAAVPIAEALEHNSKVADEEPDWSEVDKSPLPDSAFADDRAFPHHWVMDGEVDPETGRYASGDMVLHRGGLNAAWAAAKGARAGEPASAEVVAHLEVHRKALGMDAEDNSPETESTRQESIMTIPTPPVTGMTEGAGAKLAEKLKAFAERLATAPDGDIGSLVQSLISELGGAEASTGMTVAAMETTKSLEAKVSELTEGLRGLLKDKSVKENRRLQGLLETLVGAEVEDSEDKQEIRRLRACLEANAIKRELALKASELGVIDSDAAYTLMDKSEVVVAEDYSEVKGLGEALAKLVESKPYLVKVEETKTKEAVDDGTKPEKVAGIKIEEAKTEDAPKTSADADASIKEAKGQEVVLQESAASGMGQDQIRDRMSWLQQKATRGDLNAGVEYDRLSKQLV